MLTRASDLAEGALCLPRQSTHRDFDLVDRSGPRLRSFQGPLHDDLNVRGEFRTVRGHLKLNDADITQSEIEIEIDTVSIHTRDEQRDAHLRSPDFLDTERHPLLTFRSTKVERARADTRVQGDLTIHGVTRNVELDVDSTSPARKDLWGNVRLAASASTVISRKDFGLTWNAALETGGVLVGDEVTIDLDVQFVKSQGVS